MEYGTGVVVSEDGACRHRPPRHRRMPCGHDRRLRQCRDRVAEDKEHADLALLRMYGARGLKPLGHHPAAARRPRARRPELPLIRRTRARRLGREQRVKAGCGPRRLGGGSDASLSPAPGLGLPASCSVARTATANSPGYALLAKPVVVAGPAERHRQRGTGGTGTRRYRARFPESACRRDRASGGIVGRQGGGA